MKLFLFYRILPLLGLSICCALILSSCKKDIPPIFFDKPVVLVAGYEFKGEVNIAKFWINGQEVILSDGTNDARANSIFASGKNVYVAGEDNGAVYWKNGTEVKLPHACNSIANAVYVSDNDVYIGGQDDGAVYWKNGIEVRLDATTRFFGSSSNSIFILKNDVYVAGKDGNKAIYWKNGVRIPLTLFESMTAFEVANSIYVSDSAVYAAGYAGAAASPGPLVRFWKNGIFQPIVSDMFAYASSVFVSNNDVYVAGYKTDEIRNFNAVYWKNGVVVNLTNNGPDIFSRANSIYVSGKDVYAAGYNYNLTTAIAVATYWKNGTQVKLTDGTTDAYATSVFISKEKILH